MYTDQQFSGIVKKYIDTVFRIALNYTKQISDTEDLNITMDNIQERISAYKQAKVPGDGAEYVRETLAYWNAQKR